MTDKVTGEVRCICGRRPLLAVYGVGPNGKPMLHVKVYKQSRIYGEIWVSADDEADVKIRCRECLRIQKVKIVSGRPLLQEEREMMDTMEDQSPVVRVASNPSDRVR